MAAKNEAMLSEVLDCILTPEERDSVELRCLIIKALLEGSKPQRQIADELKVSIATITRGSNQLKRISSDLRQFLMNIE